MKNSDRAEHEPGDQVAVGAVGQRIERSSPPAARLTEGPVQVSGNLYHLGAEQLRLVEDFRIDVGAHRPQVQRREEPPIVGANHAGERRQVSPCGCCEEPIRRAAEKRRRNGILVVCPFFA